MSGDGESLRALLAAADGGWGPDGWYAEHEIQAALRATNTTTDADADAAFIHAASPAVVGNLLDRLEAAERALDEAEAERQAEEDRANANASEVHRLRVRLEAEREKRQALSERAASDVLALTARLEAAEAKVARVEALADEVDSIGHAWTGAPARMFFSIADDIRAARRGDA